MFKEEYSSTCASIAQYSSRARYRITTFVVKMCNSKRPDITLSRNSGCPVRFRTFGKVGIDIKIFALVQGIESLQVS